MAESHRLDRLIRPRSVAIIGGSWASKVVAECARFGFDGEVWPIHPERTEVAGMPAYSSVEALPAAPDAAFVGVNRFATVEMVRALAARGAGGAVLFASGFAEAGEVDLQASLLEAAGDMAVLGPNCYGIVNALDGAVIWPDEQGCARVDRGVAILAQSSNIAITLTMQRRGLPVAFVGCIGNAAQIGLAEFAQAVLADPRITALGVYAEGIGDAAAFARVVAAARAEGKGVVVLKAGQSEAGRAATQSHTAALSGGGAASSAYLAQIGAGEVRSLPELVETLKLLHAYGPITGRRTVSVSCSGGEAGLMADAIQGRALAFDDIPPTSRNGLTELLGPIVKISNPLDYHTFIWGDAPRMADVFSTAMEEKDIGLFVLDPPRTDRCDASSYDCAFEALGKTRRRTGRPVVTVSTLPESIDAYTAERLAALDVVPLQGVAEALTALEAATCPPPREDWLPYQPSPAVQGTLLNEAEAKAALSSMGIAVPRGVVAKSTMQADVANLTPPFAVKGLGFAHKSEEGAVHLNVRDPASAVVTAPHGVLVEEMVQGAVAEVLIGLSRDPVYGVTLTVGVGGTEAEVLSDTVTLICPVAAPDVRAAFQRLRLWPLLNGYRGRPVADVSAAVEVALGLQAALDADPSLIEIEINPLMLLRTGAVAVDAYIRRET